MIPSVLFTDLSSVRQMVGCPQALFIIPTFQRPYAWEKKQIKDLKEDFLRAFGHVPHIHYFAHIHVVPIDPAGWLGPMERFLDREIPDIRTAEANAPYIPKIYAVVDGQQRLVTLYLLSILQELLKPSPAYLLPTGFPTLFQVPLPPPANWLPRIILGTNADHNFFGGIVKWLLAQVPGVITVAGIEAYIKGLVIAPHCPSQQRMKDAILALLDQFFLPAAIPAIDLLVKLDIKMGLTELDAGYALTSFITLNDRGKSLTTLEKLKALWLQSAVTTGQSHLVTGIHHVFGDLYRLADSCVSVGLCKRLEEAEDLLVQLLYHWIDMSVPGHELWYGADTVYEWFRTQPPANVGHWHTAAQELHQQLQHLCNTYLDPAAIPAQGQSIHFPNTSILFCDYHGLLVNLRIPHHLMALLLKFRQLTGREWHERFQFPLTVNVDALMQPICDLLHSIGSIPGLPATLHSYITRIRAMLPGPCGLIGARSAPVNKSMLEAIDRIAVLAWLQKANPVAGFINTCGITFVPGVKPFQIVSEWYMFCNTTGSYDWRYIDRLCYHDAPTSQYYLLHEWERELLELSGPPPLYFTGGCPADYNKIQLEHILPEKWDMTIAANHQTFLDWGFNHIEEFRSKMLQRIGNKAILWERCNIACGRNHPHRKAVHYIRHCRHAPPANCLKQIEKVGQELRALGVGPSLHFRPYFELRCAELAAFALKRFCL